jgi:ABC-type polysaccharide/polyol phosphate export permease
MEVEAGHDRSIRSVLAIAAGAGDVHHEPGVRPQRDHPLGGELVLAWAIASGATFGAAMTLVTWRQKKILRRLRLAPVPVSAVVTGRIGVSVAFALVQTAVFIGVALLPYYGLQLSDYWWMALPLVVVGTLVFLAIGLFAGAIAKTPEAAAAIANVIVLPMAFLSGVFFPLDAAPQWIRTVSNAFPLRHLVDAMQAVMVRGEAPGAVLPALGILAGFAVVVTAISVRRSESAPRRRSPRSPRLPDGGEEGDARPAAMRSGPHHEAAAVFRHRRSDRRGRAVRRRSRRRPRRCASNGEAR